MLILAPKWVRLSPNSNVKWDNSETFSDQILVHFGSAFLIMEHHDSVKTVGIIAVIVQISPWVSGLAYNSASQNEQKPILTSPRFSPI